MPAVTCLSVRRNLLVVRRYLLACVSGMLASGVVERLAPTTLRPRQRFPERRWQLRQVGHTRHCDRFHLPCGLGGRNDRPLPNADGGGVGGGGVVIRCLGRRGGGTLLSMAVVCKTIDPRTLTMSGRSMSGFYRPRYGQKSPSRTMPLSRTNIGVFSAAACMLWFGNFGLEVLTSLKKKRAKCALSRGAWGYKFLPLKTWLNVRDTYRCCGFYLLAHLFASW